MKSTNNATATGVTATATATATGVTASATGVTATATGVSAIDFRTLPDCIPSMCIPRVYSNINQGRIRKIFDDLNIGVIEHIDIVSKTTDKGERFNRVFIHMERWFNNSNATVARERLLGGKDIKIIYDDPWFWKVSAYKPGGEGSSNNNSNNRKKATIQFDSSDDEKEKRQPKRADIKPLTVPRPRPYNNNNNNNNNNINNNNRGHCNQVRNEVIEERKPIVRDNTPKLVMPPAVQYDPAIIASNKKRVIIIRKDPLMNNSPDIKKEPTV
jgi:hypothetical protein